MNLKNKSPSNDRGNAAANPNTTSSELEMINVKRRPIWSANIPHMGEVSMIPKNQEVDNKAILVSSTRHELHSKAGASTANIDHSMLYVMYANPITNDNISWNFPFPSSSIA